MYFSLKLYESLYHINHFYCSLTKQLPPQREKSLTAKRISLDRKTDRNKQVERQQNVFAYITPP